MLAKDDVLKALLSIAPDCPCYNIICILQVFSLKELFEHYENEQNTFGNLDPGILTGSLAFSRSFGLVNDRIDSDVKKGYKCNMLHYKQMSHLSYFVQDLDSK